MQEQLIASIEVLAARIRRPRSRVAKWFERNSLPSDGATAISDTFGYSVDWLLSGNDPKFVPGRIVKAEGESNPQSRSEPSALDFEVAHVLYKLGVTDPERVAEAVGNIRHIFTRRKP